MIGRYASLLVACLMVLISLGCGRQSGTDLSPPPARDIELAAVPFFAQQKYQCGPAAVAMLLAHSGLDIIPDRVSPELFVPDRRGTFQLEIIGTIRRYDRIPYQIASSLAAITAELADGRPVLVLQDLGFAAMPVYHYAVVVGALESGEVVLRSGTTERLVVAREEFLSTWQRAGSWGVVVLEGGELPADRDVSRFLGTVADIEETGNARLAEAGYRAVLQRHPEQKTALFGLANVLYRQRRYIMAATYYVTLLQQDISAPAVVNNLAETLSMLHCHHQALRLIDTLQDRNPAEPGGNTTLMKTRQEIALRQKRDQGLEHDCPAIPGLSGFL